MSFPLALTLTPITTATPWRVGLFFPLTNTLSLPTSGSDSFGSGGSNFNIFFPPTRAERAREKADEAYEQFVVSCQLPATSESNRLAGTRCRLVAVCERGLLT